MYDKDISNIYFNNDKQKFNNNPGVISAYGYQIEVAHIWNLINIV